MRRRLFGFVTAAAIFAGGAAFAFGGDEAEYPLKGTPACPLTEKTAELPDCCKRGS